MPSGHYSLKLEKSAEAHHLGWARMVGDLATGTTYIVRDSGFKGLGRPGFISSEDSPHIPKFYTIDLDCCRSMMHSWFDLGDPSNWDLWGDDGYSKEKYLRTVEYNRGDKSIWEATWERDYPEVDDQNEVDGKLNLVKY